MPLFQREPQVSPGMFVTHVDSEPTPSGAKSEGLEWHPGDSDAGGWWPTLGESLVCSQNCPTNLPHYRMFPCCPSHRHDNKIMKSKTAFMIFTIWSLKSDHRGEASSLTKSFGLHVSGTSEMLRPLFTLASGSVTCNNFAPPGYSERYAKVLRAL